MYLSMVDIDSIYNPVFLPSDRVRQNYQKSKAEKSGS
jgi:hypothetical protein